MEIVVNGRTISVVGTSLTYDEIVYLAYSRPAEDLLYTVTYKGPRSMGSVVPGERIELDPGMIFNCMMTGVA